MATTEFLSNLPHTPAKVDVEPHLMENSEPSNKRIAADSEVVDLSGGTGSKQANDPEFVSTTNDAEPIVTRKELWSYYRASSDPYRHTNIGTKSTIMAIM